MDTLLFETVPALRHIHFDKVRIIELRLLSEYIFYVNFNFRICMSEFISIEKLNDQIKLKPRFKIDITDARLYEKLSIPAAQEKEIFIDVKQLDDHVWLSIPTIEKKYYSPRLHVEIEDKEKPSYVLHCTFGPDPNLWTMFMFLHFFLAIIFIGIIINLYTNLTLQNSNTISYVLLIFIILIWIGLYVFARFSRKKGAQQSRQLLDALRKLLN